MRRSKLDTLSISRDKSDPLDTRSNNASEIKSNAKLFNKKFDEDLAHIYGYY